MTDKSAYGGLFQDPSYLSSDPDPTKTDPYDKHDAIPSRYLGKNMTVGGRPPPGQHPDALFDKKFLTLASSEQNGGKPVDYDEDKWRTAAAKEKPKQPISDKEFCYSSYPQKSTGPGSYFGCFQNRPYEYMTEPWDDGKSKKKKAPKPQEEEEEPTHLPNIKTNRTKKGTYGYPGLLLSNPAYNENWKEEREAADAAQTRKERQQGPPPKALGPPLHIPGVSHAYLDELPNTGVSGVYTAYEPPADTAASKKRKTQKEAAASTVVHARAFCGSANRSGEQGCINAFPNKWVNPGEIQLSKNAQRKQQQEKEEAARLPKGVGVWKPNSFEKSSVVSSCLRRFY